MRNNHQGGAEDILPGTEIAGKDPSSQLYEAICWIPVMVALLGGGVSRSERDISANTETIFNY